MANTSRRYIDKNGKMFIPMNVEGGSWDEHFITTPKLVAIVGMLATAVIIWAYLHEQYARIQAYFIFYAIWFVACFYITRFFIFEEKFYYRMYKQLKQSEITTPAVFWDIASIRDTNEGAIMTYSENKVAVMVRLERDTITGKPPEFKETHYDAISDFYKAIMLSKLNFVQLNIMEQAGNDPRLEELDKLIYGHENQNIRSLMEKQVGYIKNITHHTLYESDYFLFYSNDISRIDTLLSDVQDIIYTIMDGAYIGYRIMTARDIIEFIKEEYGVKYFNYTEATLEMFKNQGIHTKLPFELSEIEYSDGDIQTLSSMDVNRINKLASDVLNGIVDLNKISIKDTLWPRKNQLNSQKIGFDTISEGFDSKRQSGHKQPGQKIQQIKGRRPGAPAQSRGGQIASGPMQGVTGSRPAGPVQRQVPMQGRPGGPIGAGQVQGKGPMQQPPMQGPRANLTKTEVTSQPVQQAQQVQGDSLNDGFGDFLDMQDEQSYSAQGEFQVGAEYSSDGSGQTQYSGNLQDNPSDEDEELDI